MSNMRGSTHAPRRNQESVPRVMLSELATTKLCGEQMNRFEKEVAAYLEREGPSTSHQIQYNLRHKYFIGSVKSIGNKMHASKHFKKVDKVILTGTSRYEVAVWEVEKNE